MKEKQPNLKSKVAKYYLAKRTGMNNTEAAEAAGYVGNTHTTRVEQTKKYGEINKYYRDELTDQISVKQIVAEHKKIIEQDVELGPKIAAIKLAIDTIEPTAPAPDNDDDKVFVVLR